MQLRPMLILLALAFALPVDAEPIQFEFEGRIAVIGSQFSGSSFELGDPVFGGFSFDPVQVDSGLAPDEGFYRAFNFSVTFGESRFSADFPARLYVIDKGSGDLVGVNVNTSTGPSEFGRGPNRLKFQLRDPTGQAFSSDDLPIPFPELSTFTSTNTNTSYALVNLGVPIGLSRQIRAEITSITVTGEPTSAPIPEPSSLVAFLVGLAVFGVATRSRG